MVKMTILENGESVKELGLSSSNDDFIYWMEMMSKFPNRYTVKVELDMVFDEHAASLFKTPYKYILNSFIRGAPGKAVADNTVICSVFGFIEVNSFEQEDKKIYENGL